MTDVGASVIARLKVRAAKDGLQLQLLLNLFCQEEFLRRIQKSKYSSKLVLKGGFLLYSISGYASRPTIDADYLLKNQSNEISEIERMVTEIIGGPEVNSFIHLEIKSLEMIAEHREYNGVRANLLGLIKNTRTPFSVDFGIGDVVVPSPARRLLPVLLPGFEQPEVLTYSLESIIAEKFDAIISRMELTSRMKDFYDIYYLAVTCNFEGRHLQEAIFETLQNRGTSYEKDTLELVERLSQDKDMLVRWEAFCKKTLKITLSFEYVLGIVVGFLNPVYEAMLKEREFFSLWSKDNMKWKGRIHN